MANVQLKLACIFCLSLWGCSEKQFDNQTLMSERQRGAGEKLLYFALKNQVSGWIENASPLKETEVIGLKRVKDLAEEFLIDLGQETISLKLPSEKECTFYYFNPHTFKEKEISAYKKWRKKFALPRNGKLAEMFHIDFQTGALTQLLRLPYNVNATFFSKKKSLGAVLFPDQGLEHRLDPKYLLSYLARGIHVIAISYEGDLIHKEETGELAAKWLQEKISCTNQDLVIVGKSFGASFALLTALKMEGSSLILDGGFKGADRIFPIAHYLIEKLYSLPTEEMLTEIKGKVLLIESFSKEKRTPLAKEISLIETTGSLFGWYWKDPSPAWYEEETTQEKLNIFLKQLNSYPNPGSL